MNKEKSVLKELPYPAILVGEKGQIIEKNRLARRLIPGGAELKGFLQKIKEKEAEPLFEASLDSVRYFVAVIPENETCKRICFLEHFLPFYEPFSQMFLGEMKDFFWQLFLGQESNSFRELTPALLDAIAARSIRLRDEEKAYLRLLDMRSYKPGERVSCSVSGFFHHLTGALARRGIHLDFEIASESGVLFSTAGFTHLVLNLVQFAYLFDGVEDMKVSVGETKRKLRFSFSFPDHLNFSFLCSSLLKGEIKEIPDALLSTPLFSVLCLCRKENLKWMLSAGEGRLLFEVFLPRAEILPSAFLSDASAEEVKELLQIEKEWFSR